MRFTATVLLFLTACVPAAPDPTPAARQLLAEARGAITDARGGPVEGSEVVVQASQKPQCAAVVTEARTTSDRLGNYSTLLSWKTAENADACITVTVRGAGTTGSGSGEVTFKTASPTDPPAVATVNVRLQKAARLTREGADAIAAAVVAAMNGDTASAGTLYSLVYGGKDAIDAGLDHLRHHLGHAHPAEFEKTEGGQYDIRYLYRLKGETGRSTELNISQDETVRVWNPLLYYSHRAERMTSEMFRLIAANDATTLARLLTADDIDYPVADAQKIIDDYRRRYGSRSLSASFDRLDETRNSIIYRIDGTKDEIEMGFGDGMLFLKD